MRKLTVSLLTIVITTLPVTAAFAADTVPAPTETTKPATPTSPNDWVVDISNAIANPQPSSTAAPKSTASGGDGIISFGQNPNAATNTTPTASPTSSSESVKPQVEGIIQFPAERAKPASRPRTVTPATPANPEAQNPTTESTDGSDVTIGVPQDAVPLEQFPRGRYFAIAIALLIAFAALTWQRQPEH